MVFANEAKNLPAGQGIKAIENKGYYTEELFSQYVYLTYYRRR